MNLNLLKTRMSLKTRLALYLALTPDQKNFQFFVQKIKSATMPDQHVKGQPATSTYVQEKGGVRKDSNRETPCM